MANAIAIAFKLGGRAAGRKIEREEILWPIFTDIDVEHNTAAKSANY